MWAAQDVASCLSLKGFINTVKCICFCFCYHIILSVLTFGIFEGCSTPFLVSDISDLLSFRQRPLYLHVQGKNQDQVNSK